MTYFFMIITSLALFACNSNQQTAKLREVENKHDSCRRYPSIVDSLQIQSLYDSARWYVYSWHCDQNYFSKSDTSRAITFGELPLIFDNLNFKHDTIEVNFNFIDGTEPILTSMTKDNKELSSGVGFDIKARKKIYMLSPNGFSTFEKGSTTRYENPLQPEVLAYIKNNWDKLDNCFRDLAEQKGIMK